MGGKDDCIFNRVIKTRMCCQHTALICTQLSRLCFREIAIVQQVIGKKLTQIPELTSEPHHHFPSRWILQSHLSLTVEGDFSSHQVRPGERERVVLL